VRVGYRELKAQKKAEVRCAAASRCTRKMTPKTIEIITKYLMDQLSPEQIAGRMMPEGHEKAVSAETIYRFIAKDKAAKGNA
jgi:IS30 family transposase